MKVKAVCCTEMAFPFANKESVARDNVNVTWLK